MQFLDKYGWPVESEKGRPIMKWLRRLVHTRKIKRRFNAQREYDAATPVPISDERINEIVKNVTKAEQQESVSK